jgi:hypothetical protein
MRDLIQFVNGDGSEFSVFRNILADESIHVFIRATLPGRIRMSKEEINAQVLSNVFVFGECQCR